MMLQQQLLLLAVVAVHTRLKVVIKRLPTFIAVLIVVAAGETVDEYDRFRMAVPRRRDDELIVVPFEKRSHAAEYNVRR